VSACSSITATYHRTNPHNERPHPLLTLHFHLSPTSLSLVFFLHPIAFLRKCCWMRFPPIF